MKMNAAEAWRALPPILRGATDIMDFQQGWDAAIDAALATIPGGQICDPQTVADDIRELKGTK